MLIGLLGIVSSTQAVFSHEQTVQDVATGVLGGLCNIVPAEPMLPCLRNGVAVGRGAVGGLVVMLASAISNKSLEIAMNDQLAVCGAIAAMAGAADFTASLLRILEGKIYCVGVKMSNTGIYLVYSKDREDDEDINHQPPSRIRLLYNAAKDSAVYTAAYLPVPLLAYGIHRAVLSDKSLSSALSDATKNVTRFALTAGTAGAVLSACRYLFNR